MSIKRALLVGCNYPNTKNQLRGCVNDVLTTNEIIRQHYGFTDNNQIRMLTDESCTTANILERLLWLVNGLVAGDVAFFHWSGHGSQLPVTNYNNNQEADGLDEILCPIDLDWRTNVIRDNDMKEIFDTVVPGVNVTILLDSCHSGTGIRSFDIYSDNLIPLDIKEQIIGPNRIKMIQTPIDIMNRVCNQNSPIKPRTVMSPSSIAYEDQTGLLIAGCADNQTSADAWIQQQNKFMGAATYSLAQSLQESNWQINYSDLVSNMHTKLNVLGYEQHPELNGQSKYFNTLFLSSLPT